MVSVALRAVPVLGAAVQVRVAAPVALTGERVNQVALLVGVQAQVLPALIFTVPLPPEAATEALAAAKA